MPSRLLDNMNDQQQQGIEAVDGPVLLLAGAGSGKTRVITHRIAYLIEERGVAADQILAVTFTNKAAKEMAERVDKIIGHSSLSKPQLSTFHSFCVRVLRRDIEALKVNGAGLTRTFAIYDETDQQAVVKTALKRLGIDDKSLKPRVALGRISWAKNHMIDPQEYFLASANPMEEKIAHIFEIYKKELFKANALDFDDLLLETVRLLKVSAETREKYNRRYKYVMIDEYQDTNRPQYELMKLLAGASANICVVGDEDQSIYSWRGADIKNILDFEKDFPNVRTIRLEQNYRSTQMILEGASAVVAQNTQRKGKNLWTSREGGSLIGFYEAPDGENEALFIADRIQQYLRKAGAEEDLPRCAVLYRTNSQSRLVEEALRRYQIQYHMVGGFSFYDRAEVKDILSYMKVVQNPHDSIAVARTINSPARGIGKTTLETLERMALSTGLSTWDAISAAIEQRLLPARALTALATYRRLIEDARAMLGPGFAEKLSEDLSDDPATQDQAGERTAQGESSIGGSRDGDDTGFDPSGFGDDVPKPSSDALGDRMAEAEPLGGAYAEGNDADTSFDTSFNFNFDFGPSEEVSTLAAENARISDDGARTQVFLSDRGQERQAPDAVDEVDAASFNPFAPVLLKAGGTSDATSSRNTADTSKEMSPAPFRKPGDAATLPELIKFLNDRSGYIKALEEEGTPESFSRIENLKELANAAQDAEQRGESLADFLDHAALVSDADQYSSEARVTLMTLHAAKGLEFPLVFLAGMEEGLFPHSRTLTDPTGLEEERRLCYVGMTRAMDTLVMTRARYRRRYGSDSPESSIASRFLEEVPGRLVEDLGSPGLRAQGGTQFRGSAYSTPYPQAGAHGRHDPYEQGERHYTYEDESQAPAGGGQGTPSSGLRPAAGTRPAGSIDNIASFFAARGGAPSGFAAAKPGQKYARPKLEVAEQTGKTGLSKGARVRHPKYGAGSIIAREGDGEDAKITVQFQQHGVKKLVEKFAQLENL